MSYASAPLARLPVGNSSSVPCVDVEVALMRTSKAPPASPARLRASTGPSGANSLASAVARSSVRFAITSDGSGVIRIQYATEVDHLPGPHGLLEYSRASGAFSFSHADRLIQRQAEAYLSSYLRRKPHAS